MFFDEMSQLPNCRIGKFRRPDFAASIQPQTVDWLPGCHANGHSQIIVKIFRRKCQTKSHHQSLPSLTTA
jgi:hypothetical protein